MATKNSGKPQRPRATNKGGASRGGSQAKSNPRGSSSSSGGSRGGSSSGTGTGRRRDESRGRRASQSGKSASNKNSPRRDANESRPRDRGGMIGSIKQHPLATAAIGAGVGLLAFEGVRRAMKASRESPRGEKGKGGREQDDDAPEADDQADDHEESDEADEDEGEEDDEGEGSRSSLSDFARNSLSRISAAMRGDTSSNRGGTARRGNDRGRDDDDNAGADGWLTNPLVLAAASLAAGAALGLLLPATRQEDRLMGKASDRIAGRLKGVSGKAIKQGRKALSDAADATAKEAEREGLTPSALGKKVRRIAAHVREAIADAVE